MITMKNKFLNGCGNPDYEKGALLFESVDQKENDWLC